VADQLEMLVVHQLVRVIELFVCSVLIGDHGKGDQREFLE
jgi:hypothetical protein